VTTDPGLGARSRNLGYDRWPSLPVPVSPTAKGLMTAFEPHQPCICSNRCVGGEVTG